MNEIQSVYVKGNNGEYYVQQPANNRWGFVLSQAAGDWSQSWPGGFDSGADVWHVVPKARVPHRIRVEMDWLLDENEEVQS